jgi:hypothetical protein
MRRWFLSYTSQDFALTQALKAALQRKDSDANIFFAPESMRVGGFWKEQLTKEIKESTAFILLVGEKGLGDWQVMEYYEALDRRAKEPDYPIILILSAKRPAPGLPFARQLHWVLTEDPASEAAIGKLIEAASGPAQRPRDLWRFTRPYRGLEAMTEANSDYFFGRDGKTIDFSEQIGVRILPRRARRTTIQKVCAANPRNDVVATVAGDHVGERVAGAEAADPHRLTCRRLSRPGPGCNSCVALRSGAGGTVAGGLTSRHAIPR